MYNERSDGVVAADLFVYVDNGWPIGPTEEVCCEASIKWGSTLSWLGIQYASRKLQGTFQEPGPWVGTVTHTTEVVCGLVYHYWWEKFKRPIQVLVYMEYKE